MSKTLQVLQLNMQKQRDVQHSVMNDTGLKEYAALVISEPYIFEMDGKVRTSPMGHQSWTAILPSERHTGRFAVRSMLWIRRDIECEQVDVPSADLTVIVLRLPDRSVLLASVYVEGGNVEALSEAMRLLDDAISTAQRRSGPRLDIVVAGDFNRHDQLWSGDEVTPRRQGEADPIIDFMSRWSLESLLPRGTKTWQNRRYASTIDLMLASQELSSSVLKCQVHGTEHGSDHRAVETFFDVEVPDHAAQTRLLFKNAPWNAIRERIACALQERPLDGDVQRQTDRLMQVVLEAVNSLVPKAKPSPYAKRWWTQDLTKLRKVYTYWRNRARAQRRGGETSLMLEQQARAAAKEYHDAIRKQQRAHWDDFLAEDTNIWKAARYLKPDDGSGWSRIPPLHKPDGSTTTSNSEQAEELLATFFPPLPEHIEDEGDRPQRQAVHMPELTLEEIESCLRKTKPWKAAGEDGLPAGVWRQVWPAVKESVRHLFQTSLDKGTLPQQWKVAKIIPLKKPGKGDYTLAKAWRPISLLSTLGKLLEAVVAERISFAVETYGLLPANHFGARKQKSAEQALLLLQERIYTAWRGRKVVSLVSFDVKGAYNGVHKDRLLQRLQARGMPSDLVKWVDAFCSGRTATIVVNGQASEVSELEQAGLPQGSPLSPILFLFFNADLVQQRIDQNGGAIAFVDDYTAWVVGENAAENRERLQAIVQRATEWERRSGASFEGDKTAFIHFTRNSDRNADQPISVKGEEIRPAPSVKILGLVMDSRLRYQEHTARAATRGLRAAMALKRLRGLSPSVTRKLFNATVAPVVDYASPVWMHARRSSALKVLKRVQRIGGQAVIGCFRTVGTTVAEVEAGLPTIEERHSRKALRLWIDLHSVPDAHPLAQLVRRRSYKRFTSPMQKIAQAAQGAPVNELDVTRPYISAPWEARPEIGDSVDDGVQAAARAYKTQDICVATSVSARNQLVGIGGACEGIDWTHGGNEQFKYDRTMGSSTRIDAFTAALASIETGLNMVVGVVYAGAMSPRASCRTIHVFTNNRTALTAIQTLGRGSGQSIVGKILKHVRYLEGFGNHVIFAWAPVNPIFELGQQAKQLAQQSTEEGRVVQEKIRLSKKTVQKAQESVRRAASKAQTTVGQSVRNIDAAWPGGHTRRMYDNLSKRQASILAQLRTDMTPLNGYLNKIKASETNLCDCGEAPETRNHFIFRCVRWSEQRKILDVWASEDNLSRLLGGKSSEDTDDWKPDMDAVRAVIHFTLATKRFEHDVDERRRRTR